MQKLLQFRMKTKMLEFSLPQIWSPGSSNQKSLLGKETSSMMTFDLDLATTILARQPNTTVRGHEPLPSVTAGDPLPSASTRRTDRGGRYQKNVWMADVPRRMIKLLGRWLTIGHCCEYDWCGIQPHNQTKTIKRSFEQLMWKTIGWSTPEWSESPDRLVSSSPER